MRIQAKMFFVYSVLILLGSGNSEADEASSIPAQLKAVMDVTNISDNPLMDIRMRELGNLCVGDSSLLDLALEVRTTDASHRSIYQIQDAVIFDAVFGPRVTSIQARQWGLPADDYQNEYKWTRSERVLEFRSTHLEFKPFANMGGPRPEDWQTLVVFRISYLSLAGVQGNIDWYAGTPNYNVSTLKIPGPGIETIHNLELDTITHLPIQCSADLSIRGRVNNSLPFQGQQVTFRFIAVNLGPSDAQNIIFTDDLLNANFSYVSHTAHAGIYDWSNHRWEVSALRREQADTLWLTVQIRTAGLIDVTMERTQSTPVDPVASNDRTTVTLMANAASDIAVDVGVDNVNPFQGEQVVFSIIAANCAGSDAESIQIHVTLPYGFVYQEHHSGIYDPAAHIWSIPFLAYGAVDTLEIAAKAWHSGSWYCLVQRIASMPPDYNNANDHAELLLCVRVGADLAVEHSITSARVWQGTKDTLDFMVFNNGGAQANGVKIATEIPSTLQPLSFNGPGSWDSVAGVWHVGSLAVGAEKRLRVIVYADSAGGPFASRAFRLTSQPRDYSTENDTAMVQVTIRASAHIFMRMYLEGAFRLARTDTTGIDTSYMACKLRYQSRVGFHSLLPVVSPYADHRDAQVENPDLLPAQVVDWIYLQFRSEDSGGYGAEIALTDENTGISGFLRKDGALVDINGEEGVLVPGLPPGTYYIVVSHRNHLKVMTSTAVNTLQLTGYDFGNVEQHYYDFTRARERYFTKSDNDQRGCVLYSVDNKWLIAAGDGDQGQQIENVDWDFWFNADGLKIGYFDYDYDLGGQVEGRDETLWYDNRFLRSPFSWDMSGP